MSRERSIFPGWFKDWLLTPVYKPPTSTRNARKIEGGPTIGESTAERTLDALRESETRVEAQQREERLEGEAGDRFGDAEGDTSQ